jgi:hypothetical protein
MPARTEVLGDGTIGREELLGVSRRLKPLHPPLPLAGRLVGILRAVVQVGSPGVIAGKFTVSVFGRRSSP